jgi:histidine ammonia-lyase
MPQKVTVQKVCKVAKNEKEVREVLDAVWENIGRNEEILARVAEKNEEIYKFERMLELT